jgi:RimJ/RimL family protein N-acetyltransferase
MDGFGHGSLSVPVIETARLRLRGHGLEDAAQMAALWSDEGVTRYIGGRAQTAEESWSRLLRYAGHWRLLGFGYWVVEEKATGAFVGEAGLSEYRREIVPALGSVAEAGWVLAGSKQGLGYATEAVLAVMGWGREHFGAAPVACMIHPDNRASIRVAEKCGFRQREIGMYKGNAALIFVREF